MMGIHKVCVIVAQRLVAVAVAVWVRNDWCALQGRGKRSANPILATPPARC